MSAQTQAAPAMNLFERYLSVWVALCIAIGILLGQVMPGVFRVNRRSGDCPRQFAGRFTYLGNDYSYAAAH